MAASAGPPTSAVGTRAPVSASASTSTGSRYAPAPNRLSTIDWEAILGRNWFAIIGAIALALGAGFFLKLAIDNNWISETARVLIGLVTGLVLLGLGEYTARRIPRWSQPVTGGGLSILYLATYASFGFYQLIEPIFALAFLFVVVAVAAILAIRHESRIIALMGITGAFLAPVLLAGDLEDQRIALLAYILIVDLGVLVVSSFYSWQWFIRIGMFATYLLFGWWIDAIPASETIVAELGVAAAFLIFVGATTLFHVIRRQVPTVWDLGLMVFNAGSFWLATIALMWDQYEGWFGLISLLIGVFYAGVGLSVLKRTGAPRQVARYSMLIALVFGTLSAPLQLEGFWITIAWAIEAAVLVGAGFRFHSDRARMFALGVFALAIARLLVLDTFAQSISEFELFTTDRIPAFAVTIVAVYIAAFLYRRNAALASEWEDNLGHSLIIGANVLTLWILTAEIFSFYEHRAQETAIFQAQEAAKNSQLSAITTMWATYAIVLVAIAYARSTPVLRWLAIGLSTLVTAKFVLYDTFAIGTTRSSDIFGANFYFASGIAVFALLAFAGIMTARYRHQLLPGERHLYSALVVAAGLVGVWTLSSEVISFFGNQADLSAG